MKQQREEIDSTYGRITDVLKKYDDESKPGSRSTKDRADIYEEHEINLPKKDQQDSELTSITGSSSSTNDTVTMMSG